MKRAWPASWRSSNATLDMPYWGLCCVFFQAEGGIRDVAVTGVQTCALPISVRMSSTVRARSAGSTLILAMAFSAGLENDQRSSRAFHGLGEDEAFAFVTVRGSG